MADVFLQRRGFRLPSSHPTGLQRRASTGQPQGPAEDVGAWAGVGGKQSSAEGDSTAGPVPGGREPSRSGHTGHKPSRGGSRQDRHWVLQSVEAKPSFLGRLHSPEVWSETRCVTGSARGRAPISALLNPDKLSTGSGETPTQQDLGKPQPFPPSQSGRRTRTRGAEAGRRPRQTTARSEGEEGRTVSVCVSLHADTPTPGSSKKTRWENKWKLYLRERTVPFRGRAGAGQKGDPRPVSCLRFQLEKLRHLYA